MMLGTEQTAVTKRKRPSIPIKRPRLKLCKSVAYKLTITATLRPPD